MLLPSALMTLDLLYGASFSIPYDLIEFERKGDIKPSLFNDLALTMGPFGPWLLPVLSLPPLLWGVELRDLRS
mgnify:CR=1 FL=1